MPRVLITDKLASYQVAHRELKPTVEHRRTKELNNRAENSHQPPGSGSGRCGGSTPAHAQRFLSAFGVISSHFRPRRYRLSASDYRELMADRFAVWRETTGSTVAA